MEFKNKFAIILSIFIMIFCSGCSWEAMLDDSGKPTNMTINDVNQMIADDALILRQAKNIDLEGETIFKSYEILKQYGNDIDFKTLKTIAKPSVPYTRENSHLHPAKVYLFYDEENNKYRPISVDDIKIIKNTKGEKIISIKDWKDIAITDKDADKYKNILKQ